MKDTTLDILENLKADLTIKLQKMGYAIYLTYSSEDFYKGKYTVSFQSPDIDDYDTDEYGANPIADKFIECITEIFKNQKEIILFDYYLEVDVIYLELKKTT